MKIIVTDALSVGTDLNFERFKEFGETELFPSVKESDVPDVIKNADILLSNKTVINANSIEKAKNLKYIGVLATGYNTIDIEYAKKKGIPVCNAGSYSTSAVAQLTIGLILNRLSHISDYAEFCKNGGWIGAPSFSPIEFTTEDIEGKTVGIIGYGNIGRRVAEILRVLGADVIVYTRTAKPDGITKFVSLDKLLNESDIISLHCPQNSDTYHLFNENTFNKIKPGCYIINTSRGGLIEEKALVDAVNSGKVSGASLDVLEVEPMTNNCLYKDNEKIILLPHSAWTTLDSRKRLLDITYNNLKSFLNGKIINRVN